MLAGISNTTLSGGDEWGILVNFLVPEDPLEYCFILKSVIQAGS